MTRDEELKPGMEVRDLRKRDYGDGVIEPSDHLPANVYHPILWNVRWDDPGLDNEFMPASQLGIING